MKELLLFVYNANGDLFSTITDFAHKVLSPSTYQCQLCALTYGMFSINEEWKAFIERLPMKATFLHKDEFQNKYGIQTSLPAVFISVNGSLHEMISSQEIRACQTLEALENLVTKKLNTHVQHNHSGI